MISHEYILLIKCFYDWLFDEFPHKFALLVHLDYYRHGLLAPADPPMAKFFCVWLSHSKQLRICIVRFEMCENLSLQIRLKNSLPANG